TKQDLQCAVGGCLAGVRARQSTSAGGRPFLCAARTSPVTRSGCLDRVRVRRIHAMRKLSLAVVCVLGMAACGWLSGRSGHKTVQLRLRLTNSSGDTVPGIVRIVPAEGGKPLELTGLYPRLRGLSAAEPFTAWYVVPRGGAQASLPRRQFQVEALSGLETRLVR